MVETFNFPQCTDKEKKIKNSKAEKFGQHNTASTP